MGCLFNRGECRTCFEECKAYKKERRILKEELQAVGGQELTITSLLNDGQTSGKQINAIMRCFKNSVLCRGRYKYLFRCFHTHHSRWRYAPLKVGSQPKEEEEKVIICLMGVYKYYRCVNAFNLTFACNIFSLNIWVFRFIFCLSLKMRNRKGKRP